MASAVSPDTADLRSAFEQVPLFAALPDNACGRLWPRARVQQGMKDDLIVGQGGPTDLLFVLLRGEATSTAVTAAGRSVVTGRWSAPTVIDKVTAFAETRHPASVTTDTAAIWCALPMAGVRAAIDTNPAAQQHLVAKLATIARSARDSFVDVAVRSSEARVARWLLITEDLGVPVNLPRPQERLALQLGMTRVTLNRAIHRLAATGLIALDEPSIVVLDRERLRQLAEL